MPASQQAQRRPISKTMNKNWDRNGCETPPVELATTEGAKNGFWGVVCHTYTDPHYRLYKAWPSTPKGRP